MIKVCDNMFSVNNEEIKERVCELRSRAKANQQDLALYLNIKRNAYQRKEASGDFNWEETLMLAEYFDSSPILIRFGAEDDELRVISKFIKNQTVGTKLMQPRVTIFDDLEKYEEDLEIYSSFLNLEENEQNRIIRYINSNNL